MSGLAAEREKLAGLRAAQLDAVERRLRWWPGLTPEELRARLALPDVGGVVGRLRELADQDRVVERDGRWFLPTHTETAPMETTTDATTADETSDPGLTYGESVRARRLARGLSQSRLGALCGFSSPQASVSQIERGEFVPSDERRRRLDEVLGGKNEADRLAGQDPGSAPETRVQAPLSLTTDTPAPTPSSPLGGIEEDASASGAGSVELWRRERDEAYGLLEDARRERDEARLTLTAALAGVDTTSWTLPQVAAEVVRRLEAAEPHRDALLREVDSERWRHGHTMGRAEKAEAEAATLRARVATLTGDLNRAMEDASAARRREQQAREERAEAAAWGEAERATMGPAPALTAEAIAERCGLKPQEYDRGGGERGRAWARPEASNSVVWRAESGVWIVDLPSDDERYPTEVAALRAYAAARGIDIQRPPTREVAASAPAAQDGGGPALAGQGAHPGTAAGRELQDNEGRKADAGKPSWTLLPWAAVSSVVAVLDYGARKYDRHNWRKVPNARQRYADALLRHVVAWLQGEANDAESGLPHLAHAACCALFLLEVA